MSTMHLFSKNLLNKGQYDDCGERLLFVISTLLHSNSVEQASTTNL